MKRYQLINALIKTYDYKSYLEIGLNNPSENYIKINCLNKESIDPYFDEEDLICADIRNEYIYDEINRNLTYRMTSDEFFEQNTNKYDIIFIDGLHTKEQVSKDIVNSLKILNKGGKIVVHDCLPRTEESQLVPRVSGEWYGDVWRSIPEFINQGLNIYTVDTDCGCAVIEYYENVEEIKVPSEFKFNWDNFITFRESLMNTITTSTFTGLLIIDKLHKITSENVNLT